ncbi:MAG TPA: BrxA family protein [Prolixibacteraceae bacterium]|nr:BrxA family protein [Prolixibacteraceae bacterium]
MITSIQRNTTYSAGFTSGSGALYHREINALLPILLSDNYSERLKQEVTQNAVLMINSEVSRRTIVRQISSRIKYAFPEFWAIYASSSDTDQAMMLFYLALNSIPLLYDFHFDVTIPAWKGSSRTFDPYNYQMKLDQLGDQFEAVDKWVASTRKLILKIYKRMLKEAGFLHDDKLVLPRKEDEFFFPFMKNRQPWFLEACFLSQADIDRITKLYTKSA